MTDRPTMRTARAEQYETGRERRADILANRIARLRAAPPPPPPTRRPKPRRPITEAERP